MDVRFQRHFIRLGISSGVSSNDDIFMLRDYSFTSQRDLVPYDQMVDSLREVLKNQLRLSLLHASPPFNL